MNPSPIPHSPFRIPHSLPRLALLIIGQTLLCVSLAISLCWNIHQAADASDRIQTAYHIGLDDGAAQFRAHLIRAIIERQLMEAAKVEKEKL